MQYVIKVRKDLKELNLTNVFLHKKVRNGIVFIAVFVGKYLLAGDSMNEM